jgi:hypothetical protein
MVGMSQFQVRFSSILFIVLYPIRDEVDPLGSHNFKGFGNLNPFLETLPFIL